MSTNEGFTYAISADAARLSFTGFADMLRYDAGKVIEVDSSLILVTGEQLTEARWQSFGIPVLAFQRYSRTKYVDTGLLRQEAIKRMPERPAPRLPGESTRPVIVQHCDDCGHMVHVELAEDMKRIVVPVEHGYCFVCEHDYGDHITSIDGFSFSGCMPSGGTGVCECRGYAASME